MTQSDSTPKDLANLVYTKLKDAKIGFKLPPKNVLNDLFQILFYTSIKTEEGLFIKLTITLIDPEKPDPKPPKRIAAHRWNYIHFNERIQFTVMNLVKLSKAVDPWSSSLAVYFDQYNELIIWGMIDQAMHYQNFLNYEIEEGHEQPGLFQTTITGIGYLIVLFDYELIATLKQNKLISNYIDIFKSGEVNDLLTSNSINHKTKIKTFINNSFPNNLLGEWGDYTQSIINESLSRILLRMQNYQIGGALLITHDIETGLDIKYRITYDRFSQSIINLIKLTVRNFHHSYNISKDFLKTQKSSIPVDLYLEESISDYEKKETNFELKGAIRFISSLSCIDGLVVLSPEMQVKGFGAVIKMKKFPEYVYTSNTTNVIENNLTPLSPNNFGTRHRSMFSYCWHNYGSIGFVVSKDGDIRAIMRVKDKLIIWENIKVQRFIRSDKLNSFNIIKRLE